MSTPPSLRSLPTAYHGAIVGGLAIGYGRLAHMISKSSPDPQLNKLNSGAAVLLYIRLAELTRGTIGYFWNYSSLYIEIIMAQFAIMAGGAILNAVAFSGSNSLFISCSLQRQ